MKTGMIGLGAMGRGMALNLSKAGHLHRVWNRSRDKAAAVAERRARPWRRRQPRWRRRAS